MPRGLLEQGLKNEAGQYAPNDREHLAEALFYTIHVLATLFPFMQNRVKAMTLSFLRIRLGIWKKKTSLKRNGSKSH